MSTEENAGVEKPSNKETAKNQNHLEHDNDTYGYSAHDVFKCKDEPTEEPHENSNSSDKLKNINLIDGDELSSRNSNEEKGLKGKQL